MSRSKQSRKDGKRHHLSLPPLILATICFVWLSCGAGFVYQTTQYARRGIGFTSTQTPKTSLKQEPHTVGFATAGGEARTMSPQQWIRYLTSVHGISGAISVLGGSVWTTLRLATGVREASSAEVVANVILSTLILITGIWRLNKLRNSDVVLKFWVGISIQIFALVQILEAPLLGWIPYSIFGNWISRIWGIISVYFYIKWLLQIKKWNEAYETKNDKTVARIFHPLMAPAMGSVVAMEVLTFVNFVELHFDLVSRCPAARLLFLDSQLVSLAVNNVAQFTLTLANQKKVSEIKPLFYFLGAFGAVQFALVMWVHMGHLGLSGLNAFTLIPKMCPGI